MSSDRLGPRAFLADHPTAQSWTRSRGSRGAFLALFLPLGLAACVPQPAPQPATVLYVDDLDDGAVGTGTADDPFRALQAAIDAAEDGVTIELLEGTHVADAGDWIDPTCGK